MATTIERTLRYGMGYAGKMGTKCYVARILGSDTQYGLRREFLEPDKVEREHFNRARTMVNFTWQLEAGLYELSEGGERWIVLVRPSKAAGLKAVRPTDERAKAMIALMDGGASFDEAREATKP